MTLPSTLPEPPEHLKQIIFGCLLGDGSINRKTINGIDYNSSFSESHSVLFEEYIKYLIGEFGEYFKKRHNRKSHKCIIRDKIANFKPTILIRTIAHPYFTSLRKKWYIERKEKRALKIIPSDLTLTPLSVAQWYAGDGSLLGHRQIMFCTDGFVYEDVQKLSNKIYDSLKIESYVKPSSTKQPQLFIRQFHNEKFIDIIKPYFTWQCFQHKISLRLSEFHKNRTWMFKSPQGIKYETKSLSEFCKKHSLNVSKMSNVYCGSRKHHRKWTKT